jgi:hypothetical protein
MNRNWKHIRVDKYQSIHMNKTWKHIRVNRFWRHISGNRIGVILLLLIEFGAISLLINTKTYQVDRIWSSIIVDKYPRHIRVDRIWRHISVDKHPKLIRVDNIQDISSR